MQELIKDLINLIGDDFEVNGTNATDAVEQLKEGDRVRVLVRGGKTLNPYALRVDTDYIIQVSPQMTMPDKPSLRFHSIWNDNIPMPMRIMVCTIQRETRGMYFVSAHGEPLSSSTCMMCGRPISHPVSQLYGLGPECGKHAYAHPFETTEELMNHLDDVEARMRRIRWSGWIIKSQIVACEEV